MYSDYQEVKTLRFFTSAIHVYPENNETFYTR